MQPTFSSSRILLPASRWFIVLSLLAALVLNFLPTAQWPAVPDWVALVLVFWSVRENRYVGMGWGFALGLAMDVADASLLGQHALAYVLAAYGGAALARRILWFPLAQQALHVLPLMLLAQAVQLVIQLLVTGKSPDWFYFSESLVSALLWPVVSVLLLAPQRRAVDRDENRPI